MSRSIVDTPGLGLPLVARFGPAGSDYPRKMPKLTARERAHLPDSSFAYIDARGRRRLPIHDEVHVRNALARFNRVSFEDDAARDRARRRLLRAAKKYGIVPVGFIDGQVQSERLQAEIRARCGNSPHRRRHLPVN